MSEPKQSRKEFVEQNFPIIYAAGVASGKLAGFSRQTGIDEALVTTHKLYERLVEEDLP